MSQVLEVEVYSVIRVTSLDTLPDIALISICIGGFQKHQGEIEGVTPLARFW